MIIFVGDYIRMHGANDWQAKTYYLRVRRVHY